MLTEEQLRLVDKAKNLGYGYKIFAKNVEAQGWCSPKQEAALRSMIAVGTYRKFNWRMMRSSYVPKRKTAYKHDISDTEAMSFGEYF